jgi:AcrR family transcriptional regulator
MRTHGWAGETPASDDEAIARIIAAARQRIDQCGKDFSISDVAKDVGVARPTIYRYFASTEALLFATSIAEAGPFLDHLADHLKDIHDPIEAVIEGIAHTLERLPHERYLSLLLTPGKASAFSAGVTSDTAMLFGRSLLERFHVDWSSVGITDDNMDGLVEFMLRIFQSLVIDPGRPPRKGEQLRSFLRRWVAPTIAWEGTAQRPARRSTAKLRNSRTPPPKKRRVASCS